MRIWKEIGFAYPSSKTAKKLGFDKTGCYFVGQTLLDLEGSRQSAYRLANNTKGYSSGMFIPRLLVLVVYQI